MWSGLPLLRLVSNTVHKAPSTLLNLYLPLRFDQNKEILDQISFL